MVESDDQSNDEPSKSHIVTKVDKMFRKKNLTVLSEHYAKLKDQEESDGSYKSDTDFMTIKRKDHDLDNDNKVMSYSF